jgi:GTP diphosphokinase / guanosine-3',5'-bis(diphosphate) 3'-diphosphatase
MKTLTKSIRQDTVLADLVEDYKVSPMAQTPVPVEPNPVHISHLCDLLEHYLEPEQIREVYRAYLFSAKAHEGQWRRSGEAYIFHPVAVAYLLGRMRMDVQTIVAALLHDVLEDTDITKLELSQQFGEQVAELVDGVSKLNRMPSQTREQRQADSFRKMMVAMSRDLRVIIIKLADRLHNMRTLGVMKPDSRRRIAKETLEIYAPIAHRLGMNEIRCELQDLSFSALYPHRHKVLLQNLCKLKQERHEFSIATQTALSERLEKLGVYAEVQEHKPNIYITYLQMKEKKATEANRKTFLQVTKKLAIQVIVKNIDACYRVLGVAHTLYKPAIDKFKDHIAVPKTNGYQSIHTELVSSSGEVQIIIGTQAMHELAEKGVTSYGLYQFNPRTGEATGAQQFTIEWLKNLAVIQNTAGEDSQIFIDHVKMDLFPEEVYVFTPTGKIINLPKNATPVDFAYAVHTDIGHRCVAALVNNKLVPLYKSLENGQVVKIHTSKGERPKSSWLDFVRTARARSQIHQYLKSLDDTESLKIGQQLLDEYLHQYHLSITTLTKAQKQHACQTFKVANFDNLLKQIAWGEVTAILVAQRLSEYTGCAEQNEHHPYSLAVGNTEGNLVNYAQCCCPLPDDEIVGILQQGRGIMVHTNDCKKIAEYYKQPELLLMVQWEKEIQQVFYVGLHVEVRNQSGVLAQIANVLAELGVNIEKLSNENRDASTSLLKLCLCLRDRKQLANVMRKLRRLSVVTHIQRHGLV